MPLNVNTRGLQQKEGNEFCYVGIVYHVMEYNWKK